MTQAVYENEDGSRRLIAIRYAVEVNNRPITRPWSGIDWVVPTRSESDGASEAAVMGLGVARGELERAAEGTLVGQDIRVSDDALPRGFRLVAEGDAWSTLSETGIGFLQGTLVRWVDTSKGVVIEYTRARYDDRLARLAQAIIDPATGQLPWGEHRAVSVRRGDDLVVVAGTADLSDLDRVARS